jgi:transcriptional regulatory protein LevR/transcriptional regulator with AAA-type ATPase domain
LSAERGVTAGELAANLGLSRANVSSDLNCLYKEHKVEKYGSKPIYYRVPHHAPAQSAETVLDAFIKENQSLFHCVEEAKAAILYPPHGMNILLLGETGVGKSMFAELIYRYASECGILSNNAKFVVFNCADYSDNPQLLVSQLMGTKKGAYTGADSDRAGLLEKADGGILFLDEVHRLPPQGQEMLFTFIDKGIYRRLGETEALRSASVLLICATTENPNSSLLKTFVRRIPMIIKIPNLNERSVKERLNLIKAFFTEESARLGNPISVSINSVRSLLGYSCPNNIGQLKNDIQIICAKAYSNYVSGKTKELCVVSQDLPDEIREGLSLDTQHRQIWSSLVEINDRFCVFDSKSGNQLPQNVKNDGNIYDRIDSRVQAMKNAGADDNRIAMEINDEIRNYFEKYAQASTHAQDFSSIKNLVGADVVEVADQILSNAEKKLSRTFGNNIRYGLAVHIYSAVNRIRRGRKIVNPQLNLVRKNLSQEFSIALDGLEKINRRFHIDMPIDEAGFLAVFFNLSHFEHCSKTMVVVIAHGACTATSMAEAANRLLGINYAIGIDASLEKRPQDIYLQLKETIKNHPANSGVLLLVDMGSLTDFSSDLHKELGIQTKVIPLVSTLHVIEAARKASLGYSLEYVYQETLRVNEQISDLETSLPMKDQVSKLFIITACSTGEGSATLLKNILDSQIDYHSSLCETIALKLTDQKELENRLDAISKIGKILCVVSTFHVDFSAPYFNLTDVLNGSAIPKIQMMIDQEAVFEKISHSFATMLKNGESEKIFLQSRSAIETIEEKSGLKLTSDAMIGVLCHMGCMIDRLLGQETIAPFPQKEDYIKKRRSFFQRVKNACLSLQQEFSITIPDDEICHIMNFFAPENCESSRVFKKSF